MQSKKNFLNIEDFLKTIDIPIDQELREKILKIFTISIIICKNELLKKNIKENNKLKINLIELISLLTPSEKEFLVLILYKINFNEHNNITPILWLTSESLQVLIKYKDIELFPVTGKNLFKKWCKASIEKTQNEINILKNKINLLSNDARILIYKEILKWDINKIDEDTFDLFLSFLSYLKKEEVKNLILVSDKVA